MLTAKLPQGRFFGGFSLALHPLIKTLNRF
jgi:hypothetical protein